MKIDLYTKIVLTIIASCLTFLCFSKSPRPVQAQPQIQTHVIIDGVNTSTGALAVGLIGTDLKVTSTGIGNPLIYHWEWDTPVPVRVVSPTSGPAQKQ